MKKFAPAALVTAALATAAILVPALPASADDLCGSVITAPGTTISLGDDLHCASRGITVRADNVTIDLNGHTIYGGPSDEVDPVLGGPSGVTIYHAGNTVVEGGAIEGFSNAVLVEFGAATQLRDLQISRTRTDGIQLDHVTNIALTRVTLTGPGAGVYARAGIRGNNVTAFTAESTIVTDWSDAGVTLDTVNGFSFRGSTSANNFSHGLSLMEVSGRVEIDRSTVDHNDDGIVIYNDVPTAAVTISNSTASGNRDSGVYTTSEANVVISNVTADNNGGDGIWLDAVLNSGLTAIPFLAAIQGSTANGNGHSGVSISGGGRWTLTGNHVEANVQSGFSFSGGQAILASNVATGNTENGFTWYAGSSGTSTRDTATRNAGAGVVIGTDAGRTVTIVNASVASNTRDGLVMNSGIAHLTGGSYSANGLDGVRTVHGEVDARQITAFKNHLDGIAFLAGSTGTVDKVNSSKNSRYGICIVKGLSIGNVPTHVLLGNLVAPRGSFCAVSLVHG